LVQVSVYDSAGNLNRTARFIDADQSQTITTSDTEITQYAWDNRNRLTKVKSFADYASYSGNTPEKIVDYLYDCENRCTWGIPGTPYMTLDNCF
jgi:hypothetical protein